MTAQKTQHKENGENKESAKPDVEMNHEKPKNVPFSCVGCVRWEKFGKQCFYFWENKKHCTMWTGSWDEVIVQ